MLFTEYYLRDKIKRIRWVGQKARMTTMKSAYKN